MLVNFETHMKAEQITQNDKNEMLAATIEDKRKWSNLTAIGEKEPLTALQFKGELLYYAV